VGKNLYKAMLACKDLNREVIQQESPARWSWDRCFDIFTKHLNHH
jgi:hypothetical protein